jgi:hypothetical protein
LNQVTYKVDNAIQKQRGNSLLDPLDVGNSQRICCTSLTEGLHDVKPVGWMAIFGDGLGNFIDGLSIGFQPFQIN